MNRYPQDRLEPEMKNHEQDADTGVQRINDQLHFVHHVKDEQGKVVTTVAGPLKVGFAWPILAN